MKLVFQALTIVVLFFSTWFILNQVDWATIFHVEENTKKTEEKLGDLYWDLISKTEQVVESRWTTSTMDSLLKHICVSNDIDSKKIKLHIVEKDEVNAFALPNNHIVVFTGLIEDCENQAELCGVICHELGHLQMNHVMKKLTKEAGLSVIISMTSGRSGGTIIRETLKILSSSAYDRSLESEADMRAVDYMRRSKLDPAAFATFLFRMSQDEKNIPEGFFWISTHPNSEERSKVIMETIENDTIQNKNIIDESTWDKLVDRMKEDV